MLIQANALHLPIAAETVQCVVTSPPYWGLRDYGTARWMGGSEECDHQKATKVGAASTLRMDGREHLGPYEGEKAATFSVTPYREACGKCGAIRIDSQLGLERTPEEYVANMVAVFREVWRVLKPDGTIWVNLGDSYSGYHGNSRVPDDQAPSNKAGYIENMRNTTVGLSGLKPKDLVGIPWRVAFALQADGWYLRSDIIWSKPNPMPESVTDRPTKAHEYLFLLAKSERYYYDAQAIKEPAIRPGDIQTFGGQKALNDVIPETDPRYRNGSEQWGRTIQSGLDGRNRRTVWHIPTQPWSGAHFATFPEKLVEPCILAGSRPGDLVLDPFVGSGTVLRVATKFQRRGVGCDINLDYLAKQADKRTRNVQVQMVWEESAG